MRVNKLVKWICVLLLFNFNRYSCFDVDSPLMRVETNDIYDDGHVLSRGSPVTAADLKSTVSLLNKKLDQKLKIVVDRKLSSFNEQLRGDESTKAVASVLLVEVVKYLRKYTSDPAILIDKIEDLVSAKLSEKDKTLISTTLKKLNAEAEKRLLQKLDSDKFKKVHSDPKKRIFTEEEEFVLNYDSKEQLTTTCAEILIPILLPLLEPILRHALTRITSKSFYIDIKDFFENLFKIKQDEGWTFWSGLKRIFVGESEEDKIKKELKKNSEDIFKDLLIKLNKPEEELETEFKGKVTKTPKDSKRRHVLNRAQDVPEGKEVTIPKEEDPEEEDQEEAEELSEEVKELLKKSADDLTQEEINKIEQVEGFDFKALGIDFNEIDIVGFIKQLLPEEKKLTPEEEKIKKEIKKAFDDKKIDEFKRKVLKLDQLYEYKLKYPNTKRKFYQFPNNSGPVDESKFNTSGKLFLALSSLALFLFN